MKNYPFSRFGKISKSGNFGARKIEGEEGGVWEIKVWWGSAAGVHADPGQEGYTGGRKAGVGGGLGYWGWPAGAWGDVAVMQRTDSVSRCGWLATAAKM